MKQLSPSTRGAQRRGKRRGRDEAGRKEWEAAVIIRGVQFRDDQRDLSVWSSLIASLYVMAVTPSQTSDPPRSIGFSLHSRGRWIWAKLKTNYSNRVMGELCINLRSIYYGYDLYKRAMHMQIVWVDKVNVTRDSRVMQLQNLRVSWS